MTHTEMHHQAEQCWQSSNKKKKKGNLLSDPNCSFSPSPPEHHHLSLSIMLDQQPCSNSDQQTATHQCIFNHQPTSKPKANINSSINKTVIFLHFPSLLKCVFGLLKSGCEKHFLNTPLAKSSPATQTSNAKRNNPAQPKNHAEISFTTEQAQQPEHCTTRCGHSRLGP